MGVVRFPEGELPNGAVNIEATSRTRIAGERFALADMRAPGTERHVAAGRD